MQFIRVNGKMLEVNWDALEDEVYASIQYELHGYFFQYFDNITEDDISEGASRATRAVMEVFKQAISQVANAVALKAAGVI